jgi:hypothetical protein
MDESLQPTIKLNGGSYIFSFQCLVIVLIARLFDVSRLSVHGMVPGPNHTYGTFGECYLQVQLSGCYVKRPVNQRTRHQVPWW